MPAHLLVIEDNLANMDLMTYLLQAFGYELSTAVDGESGMRLIEEVRPDCIICDVQLPGIDGYEIARWLKGRDDLKSIPIIAVTALAMVGDREKVLAAGFDSYLAKPIAPESFQTQVEAVLRPELWASRSAAGDSANGESPAHPEGGQVILLVDDEPVNMSVLRGILEPSGYTVVEADSVARAAELLDTHRPALILSDYWLPAATGLEFLRRVRTHPELGLTPFMVITSTGSGRQARRACLAAGATRFLIRPIEPQALLEAIAECLDSGEPPAPG